MTELKAETEPYLAAFRDRAEEAGEPRWLATRRETALARFGELGFPTRREEAWRFTDLRPLQRAALPPAPSMSTALVSAEAADALCLSATTHRLVFVNGLIVPSLSDVGTLPAGAWLASTAATLAQRPDLIADLVDATDTAGAQPFASLNAAFFADGFVLVLEAGVTLAHPVEIIHIGRADAPQSLHLRNLVRLGSGARASLCESYSGSGVYWTNAVTTVDLSPDAVLGHVKLQDEGPDAIHFAVTRTAIARSATYDSFVLTTGSRLSRHDTLAAMNGDHAVCALDGAYLLRGIQEATNATFVDHAAPGGTTRELFHGVVEEQAHGVFLGKIGVRPDAQQTNAHQLNRNLLLGARAVVDTKPELEILADDVKCSHGATVGDLDETALFYLMSRGIAPAEARHMLIEAFATAAIERVPAGPIREHLAQSVERWLTAGAGRAL